MFSFMDIFRLIKMDAILGRRLKPCKTSIYELDGTPIFELDGTLIDGLDGTMIHYPDGNHGLRGNNLQVFTHEGNLPELEHSEMHGLDGTLLSYPDQNNVLPGENTELSTHESSSVHPKPSEMYGMDGALISYPDREDSIREEGKTDSERRPARSEQPTFPIGLLPPPDLPDTLPPKPNQSYYFPLDPNMPSWRPIYMSTLYLSVLTLTSISLALVQEYLLRLSTDQRGLMRFTDINGLSVGKYFLWRYFPTIIAVFHAVAYQMTDIQVKRLEPYYKMSGRSGAVGTQSLGVDSTDFFAWFQPPWPGSLRTALSSMAYFTAVVAVPLIQSASLDVGRTPDEREFFVFIQPVWSRILTAAFAFIAADCMLLCIHLSRRPSGLESDPGGIIGLQCMIVKSHFLGNFQGLDGRSSDHAIKERLNKWRFHLHKNTLWLGEETRHVTQPRNDKYRKPYDYALPLPKAQGVPSFLFIFLALVLLPVLLFTPANSVLDRIPFFMTAIGVTVKLLWTLLDSSMRLTEPYYQLARRHASPINLAVDYTGTLSFALPVEALRNHHRMLALVAANSILLEVLIVCLSSFGASGDNFRDRVWTLKPEAILEENVETFRSFWVSFAFSMIILTSLCVTALLVYWQRHDVRLPRKPGSLAYVILISHGSTMLLDYLEENDALAKKSTKEKLQELERLSRTYGFGWYWTRQGQLSCGIDKEPIYASYTHNHAPTLEQSYRLLWQ